MNDEPIAFILKNKFKKLKRKIKNNAMLLIMDYFHSNERKIFAELKNYKH